MKARESFLRGGQESMARRMDELLAEQLSPLPRSRRPSTRPPEPFQEIDEKVHEVMERSPSVRPPSIPPPPVSLGAARLPSILPPASVSEPPSIESTVSLLPASDFARQRLLIFPTGGAVQHESGVLLVATADGFACRQGSMRGVIGGQSATVRAEPLPRVVRGKRQDEPLGGAIPLLGYSGATHLILGAPPGRKLHAFALSEEVAFVREDLLVGFDGSLLYENGRLAVGDGEAALMVQLRGAGPVVLETAAGLGAIEILEGQSVVIRRDLVLGWVGRLLPQALPSSEAPAGQRGLVRFLGSGSLLIELPLSL